MVDSVEIRVENEAMLPMEFWMMSEIGVNQFVAQTRIVNIRNSTPTSNNKKPNVTP